MTTVISVEDIKWDRHARIYLANNELVFDTADGEYGLGKIPIDLLREKLKEHDEKIQRGVL